MISIPASAPETRVTCEAVAAFAADLRLHNAAMTVQGRIHQLGRAMRALAPSGDWAWLQRAADRLRATAEPIREKRARLQRPDALVALGKDLMGRAEASDAFFAAPRAVLYRDGLIIAFLAHRPIRARNLASMQLGQHLVQRNGAWWVSFAAQETKTKLALDTPFPSDLVPYLETYLAKHRPVLLAVGERNGREPTQGIWVSKNGEMMGQSAIAFQSGFGLTAAAP